jgi:two-component system KDP operon response regulator KdpE
METILIIEDDAAMLRGLKDNFEYQGYGVLTAADGEEGLNAALDKKPDLILLDIMLPKINGYEICRLIRQEKLDMPIIMLTAKGEESDIVLGLNLGADDYVTKPFSHIELIARVQAVMRRARGAPAPAEELPYTSGKLHVDFARNEVMVNGKPVKLTSTEYKLLFHLIKNEGRLLPHENLLVTACGEAYRDARDLLRVHIQHLRQKLGDNVESPSIIVTEHGMGYKFVSPA